MRRRAMPIGWPRRDPRHYRFAVPNAVWECKLKPIKFVIFSYLCYHRSASKPTPEEIAVDVHMTVGTVKRYLDSLSAKELVNEDGTPALNCKDEKFFTLPNEVFLLQVPPSMFMVYAYLLLIEDRRTHTCHPSYNTIAAAIGVSKNTAMKSIGTLLEMGLITVESSSYFDKRGMKWKGNNLYAILPMRSAVMRFTNDNSVNWNWMRNADVSSNDKRNTTTVTPERPCVPQYLLWQHLMTHSNCAASCAPVERRKARDGGEQDKSMPP